MDPLIGVRGSARADASCHEITLQTVPFMFENLKGAALGHTLIRLLLHNVYAMQIVDDPPDLFSARVDESTLKWRAKRGNTNPLYLR